MIKTITILILLFVLIAQLSSNSSEKMDYVKYELETDLSIKLIEIKELAKKSIEWEYLDSYVDSMCDQVRRNKSIDFTIGVLEEFDDILKSESSDLWKCHDNLYGVMDTVANEVKLYEHLNENWEVVLTINNENDMPLDTLECLIMCDVKKETTLDVSLLYLKSGERFRKSMILMDSENCMK